MEADANSSAKETSFEFDISVSLLLGNHTIHETTPTFTNDQEENQVGMSSENENEGMSNNPSEVVDDPNLLQLDIAPPCLDTPAPATDQQVQMGMQNAPFVEPLPPQQDVNWINPPINQFNNQPPELFQSQPMAPVNHNPTIGGDQHVQFITMFPQPQMWMNQQHPVPNDPWLSLNTDAPNRPGPQNLPNNQLQLYNHQVPGIPLQNVYDHHNSHNFMPPVTPFHHGPQQFQHQLLNQVPMIQSGCEMMLADPSLILRPPPQHQQHLHYHNSVPNSMLPWYQQSFYPHQPPPFNRQMSLSDFLATPFDPRQYEQNVHPWNSGGHKSQDTRGNENIQLPFPLELDTEPLTVNRKGKETQRVEHGESSSSHKRKRVQRTTQESNQSQRTERNPDVVHLSNLRTAKNAVYDPLFEAIGIPVDPHLRMFTWLYH